MSLDIDTVRFRPAQTGDTDAVRDLWFEGWWDGHGAVAPEGLRRHRDLAGIAARIPPILAHMTVAEGSGGILGFVSVKHDELANFFIARDARGSGLAPRLLAEGEAMLAARGIDEAFLWCAVGNGRAYRFYLREGWRDGGVVQCDVATPDGPVRLPSHRMLKCVTAHTGRST